MGIIIKMGCLIFWFGLGLSSAFAFILTQTGFFAVVASVSTVIGALYLLSYVWHWYSFPGGDNVA